MTKTDMKSDDALEAEDRNSTKKDVRADKGLTDSSDAHSPVGPSAPEGGYGWVIVVASFMGQFIVDGTAFSFGVFSPDFEVYFSSSSGKTSLVGSVLSGCYLMTAPFASVLTNRFGYRPVTIAGSLIGAFGFGISSLSSSIDVLLVTFGIIGGVGLGLIYLPGIVAVSEYFDRRRPLATGIVVCGSGVGCFLFAPFFDFLIREMGWKYAVVILAGITLNGCVFGALMRPLPRPKDTKTEVGVSRKKNALDGAAEVLKTRNRSVSSDTNDNLNVDLTKKRMEELRLEKEEKLKLEEEENERKLEEDGNDDRLFKDSELCIQGSRKRIDAASRLVSTSTLHIAVPLEENNRTTGFLRVTGLYLLRDPLFCIPCLANLFAMIGLFIPFYFISVRASLLPDTDGTKAAFLISIIAITNTGGRLLAGFVAGFKNVSPLLIHNVALVTGGAACIVSMLCVNYWLTAIYAAYFGLCVAAWMSLTSIILCDLLGIKKLSNSFGILTMARGISTLIGPPIAGNIYDSTRNYDNSFHIGGVMLMFGGLICLLLHLPSLQRRKFSVVISKNENQTKEMESQEKV